MRSILLVALCWASFSPLTAGQDRLTKSLEKLMRMPPFHQGHWGMLIVDAKTGETVYEKNADRLFAPASVTKLFSCATALCELGPSHRFKTPVYQRGTLKDGRLEGDLILVGSGDLFFGGRNGKDGKVCFKNHDHTYANGASNCEITETDPLAGLKDLARQIKKSGINVIKGEVTVDDRLFQQTRGSGSGPDYISPIVVNDNVIDIIITPGKKVGMPAEVRLLPETSYVQLDNQLETVAKGKPAGTLLRRAGDRRFTIQGQIPIDRKPLIRIYPIHEPASFARALFIEVLRKEGVRVEASPLRDPESSLPDRSSYAKLKTVAEHVSVPFSEMIKVTLKVSHNLYASTLPLLVAAKHDKEDLADGLKLQGEFLKKLGVNVSAISFAGGAGGNNADRVTPRQTVRLLQEMAKRSEHHAYREALPILGVDGTLEDAVSAESAARGRGWAKTGTLGWTDLLNDRILLQSKALAGALKTEKGRELLFAVFVNDAPLPRGVHPSRVGKLMGSICEAMYFHTSRGK